MVQSALDRAVRNYNLFGEAGDLPDVVHCETIAARSQLHDWELAPHRHARLHQVLLVASGGGRAAIEGKTHRLAPRRAVNVPMGAIHSFSFRPGTQGWVVTLASELMETALHRADEVGLVLKRPAVFPSDAVLRGVVERIFAEYEARDFARAQVLRALCGQLLGLVARALPRGAAEAGADGPAGASASAPSGAFARFEGLLEAHFAEHWAVADYAHALGITPAHLSRILRAATGRSASHLIDERIVREARRNLVYTNLPVSTIAYELGFADPAYFSRVFARATGMPPRRFRDLAAGAGEGNSRPVPTIAL